MANPFEALDNPESPRKKKPAARKDGPRMVVLGTLGAMAVLFVLCCGFTVAYQVIFGGPTIGAIGSRRITEKEFDRVQEGMTRKQVTDLLGPPARTGYRAGRSTWYWYGKDGRTSFSIDFDDADRVRDRGIDTPARGPFARACAGTWSARHPDLVRRSAFRLQAQPRAPALALSAPCRENGSATSRKQRRSSPAATGLPAALPH
jgi:outer membrane protein assembly factor BamE (lipoprotein component of BamABCDE complex)